MGRRVRTKTLEESVGLSFRSHRKHVRVPSGIPNVLYDGNGRAWIIQNGEVVPFKVTRRERDLYLSRHCFELCIVWYGGGACTCCGETRRAFLTIDHPYGRGSRRHPSDKLRGAELAVWLVRHDFPDGFQILCWNCNCASGIRGGECPHVAERRSIRESLKP